MPAKSPSTSMPKPAAADIREIVRRTVLATGTVTATALLATIQSGRFKPELPQGTYL